MTYDQYKYDLYTYTIRLGLKRAREWERLRNPALDHSHDFSFATFKTLGLMILAISRFKNYCLEWKTWVFSLFSEPWFRAKGWPELVARWWWYRWLMGHTLVINVIYNVCLLQFYWHLYNHLDIPQNLYAGWDVTPQSLPVIGAPKLWDIYDNSPINCYCWANHTAQLLPVHHPPFCTLYIETIWRLQHESGSQKVDPGTVIYSILTSCCALAERKG